jgi:hypothetical protein
MRVFVSFLSVEFTILLGRLFMFLPLCLAVLFSGVTLDKACPYSLIGNRGAASCHGHIVKYVGAGDGRTV